MTNLNVQVIPAITESTEDFPMNFPTFTLAASSSNYYNIHRFPPQFTIPL